MSILIMVLAALAIIGLVKYGLVAGLGRIANALNWSAKVRGQAMGYATSAPELVTLVAAGLAGVWEAGLWNIASSNIINTILMLSAVTFYRQGKELLNRRFVDELGFATLGILAPVLLMQFDADTHWAVVPILFGLFAVYQVVDRRLNPTKDTAANETVGDLPVGVIMCSIALVLIAVSGFFLGGATKEVVEQAGIHPALAGWILGVVTSLPEMVTFFAVYRASHEEGTAHLLDDTQEVLDNLAASNMSNTGLIYPLGLLVYLVVTGQAG